MTELAWATDIHMNFLDADERQAFLAEVRATAGEALLLSGDIAESPTVVADLQDLAAAFGRPVLFVLGNHDYYRGGIRATRQAVAAACAGSTRLHYLSQEGIVAFGDQTAVVGHDGWGDGRLGDFFASAGLVNDFRVIDELKFWKVGPEYLAGLKRDRPVETDLLKWKLRPADLDREAVAPVLQALGAEAAQHLAEWLPQAMRRYAQVIVLTHVPPFAAAAYYRGCPCDPNWLPYYTCGAVGEVLLEVADRFPQSQMLVLCGHTHADRAVNVCPNLRVQSGHAEYMEPRIQQVLSLP